MRRLALFAVLAAALVASTATADAPSIPYDPTGGVAGGGVLYMPDGDVYVRNVQGGTDDDPNLDLGAGSTAIPGTIALNWDIGRCTVIYDGHKHPLAKFCPEGITFYVKPRVRRASPSP